MTSPTILAADRQPLAVGDRVSICDDPPHNYSGVVIALHTEGLVWVAPDGREDEPELERPSDVWHEDAERTLWVMATQRRAAR